MPLSDSSMMYLTLSLFSDADRQISDLTKSEMKSVSGVCGGG